MRDNRHGAPPRIVATATVTLLICVAIGLLAIPCNTAHPNRRPQKTETQLKAILHAILAYKSQNAAAIPPFVDAPGIPQDQIAGHYTANRWQVDKLSGHIMDYWGTPIIARLVPHSHGRIQVISAGDDRRFGTRDDLVMDEP